MKARGFQPENCAWKSTFYRQVRRYKDELCCIFCGGFISIAAIGSSRKIHGCTYKASGSDLVQTEEMLPHN